jgi:penicillin G amidase
LERTFIFSTTILGENLLPTRFKVIFGILGVLIVSAVAGFFFIRFQIKKSFPETSGSISLSGVRAPVEITRDEFGVPRIAAQNEHDLMFSFGYVHAQDRLWQMDMARRIGQGRLSELLGTVTIPFDKMFRIVGIRQIAEEVEKTITPESRARLQSYADGVNAFIDSHKGKYPIEFDLLRYEPEPWQPVHSLIVARLMAWELNLSWWTDLTLGGIVERVGYDKAQEVFPTYPSNVNPIVPSAEWRRTMGAAISFLETAHDYCEYRGIGGTLGGSNAWVVAPQKSATGRVILANDTHLQLTQPSKWYEVKLKAPGYDVMGFSIAGVPGVVAGHNANIAWGLTNVMADDADFYIEKIDSADAKRYIYDGKSLPIQSHEEEIFVRNDTSQYVLVRSTHHGPIVTDIKTMLKKANAPYVASMRWTGSEMSDQIAAFNAINRASNWDEFKAGVQKFTGPGQNFVYGDAQGNIGYWCGVLLPIRPLQQSSTLPLSGWTKETEWQGFVPFEQLPHLYNPPEGYIATANNKIVDDSYPYHISDLWEPPSRIQRLREILGKEEHFSVLDFEQLQNDQFSNYAKQLTPYIVNACSSGGEIPNADFVLEYLKSWNFVFGRENVATSIYQTFLTRLLYNLYEDEMGPDLFHDYVILVNVPLRVTMRLVEEGSSVWFDNIRTGPVETRDDIIRQSMREAVNILRDKLGDEMKHWQWGGLHTLTLQHPFGLQKPLDKIFSIGPFPYGGASTALTSGEYNFNDAISPSELGKPYGVTVGASFRHIVDISKPFEYKMVLPSGESGQVFSKHYDDQTHLYLNGIYRTVRSDDESASHANERLTLNPAR